MPAISPILRITIGLILLTASLLLIGDLLGLAPDQTRAEIQARKTIAESLAVQVSNDVAEGRVEAVKETMRALQERNDDVVSIGLRMMDRRLVAQAGDHVRHWQPADEEHSTATHVFVPIHNASGRWGVLEVRFAAPGGFLEKLLQGGSIVAVILFVTVSGFLAYWLFLKRALNELDPSAVVPDRVRTALDVLAEGLVILDHGGRIVLANAAFQSKLGQSQKTLISVPLSALGWDVGDSGEAKEEPTTPWQAVLDGEAPSATAQLRLRNALKEKLTFAINVAPIKSPDGNIRGAVVTFDDVTQLERKNSDLERALHRLKETQREITRQNHELQVLATRDPLTGSLNRRSLFEGMETLLRDAAESGEPVSCIMVDIDHFKSINDRFGHATGDKVIKLLAKILADTARTEDLVGRYGGEEFCVVLPGVDEPQAAEVAERMRIAVHDGRNAKFTSAIRISASFGVSTDDTGSLTAGALVDYADKALYQAKQTGRNRVVRFSVLEPDGESSGGVEAADTAKVEPAAPAVSQVAGIEEARESQQPRDEADSTALRARVQELEAMIKSLNSDRMVAVDDATGLPNRLVLVDRIRQGLERSARLRTQLAVLVIDIDTLHVIRSTHGDSVAEKLVKIASARLRKTLRGTDTIAVAHASDLGVSVSRIGGSEFAVVLTDIKNPESTTWVVQRILAEMEEVVDLEGNEVLLDTRVGISLYPMDADTPEALLAHADTALREAKGNQARNACLYYGEDMNRRSEEQLRMEGQLHRAIERDELFLEYQPLVDMRNGRVSSFEALVRWRHSERGLVPPNLFIEVAEHAGLIDEIGDWVLRQATQQLSIWQDSGHDSLSMAINFSAVQFRKADLAERVVKSIEQTGISSGSLVIEITESALIENIEGAVAAVEQLNRAGVRIALDDFGTGYSSLSYLKRFPIDVVKIDRSFLKDFPLDSHDTAIVSAIIAMAHSLGLRVVAEGVETDQQLQVLQNLKCDSIQGYLFSRPISREQATALLASPGDIRRRVRAVTENGLILPGTVDSALAGVLNEAPRRSAAS